MCVAGFFNTLPMWFLGAIIPPDTKIKETKCKLLGTLSVKSKPNGQMGAKFMAK